MWIVREGYEGLVRGNQEHTEIRKQVNTAADEDVLDEAEHRANKVTAKSPTDEYLLHNLRFGDGDLLKDGTSEYAGGRTLKGRYIVRVGWDDVRGWFSEVRCSCHRSQISKSIPPQRVVLSLELPDLRLSGQSKGVPQPCSILSKRASMPWSYVVVMAPLPVQTSSARNGPLSSKNFDQKVCIRL